MRREIDDQIGHELTGGCPSPLAAAGCGVREGGTDGRGMDARW